MLLFLLLKKQTTSFLDPFSHCSIYLLPLQQSYSKDFPVSIFSPSILSWTHSIKIAPQGHWQATQAKPSGLTSAFLLFGLPPTSDRCSPFPNIWFFIASPGLHHLFVFFLFHQSLTFQSPFLVPLFLGLSEAHPVNFYFIILRIWLLSSTFLFPKASIT